MKPVKRNLLSSIHRSITRLRQNRHSRLLLCLSLLLIIAAAVTGFLIYNEGAIAAGNAHRLLAEYTQGKAVKPYDTTVPASAGASSQPGTHEQAASQIPQTYEGYGILGTLSIDKIGEELPIISATSDKALKVSCCYYQGSLPGQDGNMVITGHDYADGSIFGKLSELKTGDTVVVSTGDAVYDYTVYETEVITPDDTAAPGEYQGERALTLMTCTDHGNRRLLVRCSFTGAQGE